VTTGIKINDPWAIDSRTGIHIVAGMVQSQSKVGSCASPAIILIAKDTKELYTDHFTDYFAFFKGVKEHGFGQFTKPFLVSSPQDLPSFWK
jgi:hypothetical protein